MHGWMRLLQPTLLYDAPSAHSLLLAIARCVVGCTRQTKLCGHDKRSVLPTACRWACVCVVWGPPHADDVLVVCGLPHADDVLVMATVMNMLNIPFKECFTVCTAWEVRPSPGGSCVCNIYGKVRRC
jgi:hypothetical protein